MTRWIRWLPSVLWMAAIFTMSARTGNELGTLLPFFRKLFPGMQDFNWGHFIVYYVLAWTYLYGFGERGNSGGVKTTVVGMCVLYGLTDEYHQFFVDGRSADWRDLRNDAIGAGLAMLTASVPAVSRFYRSRFLRKR